MYSNGIRRVFKYQDLVFFQADIQLGKIQFLLLTVMPKVKK